MEQDFVEKIFQNYDHLKGKYIGCFCKDQMDELSRKIKINMAHDVNPRAFALINTGHLSSSGEQWMGLVVNKVTKCCGYFDSFGRYFKWLHEPLKKIFNEVHRTSHIVQAESSQTCGLHSIYFIVRMMNPKDVTNMTRQVNVGQYVRRHYDTKSNDTHLKDDDIVKHLSKKFNTNFNMLLPPKRKSEAT